VLHRRELSPDEIRSIVKKDWLPVKPSRNVYNKAKMGKVLREIAGIEDRKRKKKSLRNIQAFMTKEERDRIHSDYGPYGDALRNNDERRYFLERRDEILNSPDFDIDPVVDMNFVMMCVMDEIILQRLLRELALNPINPSIQKQIGNVQNRYRKNMESLAATRRQRKEESQIDSMDSLAVVVKKLYDNRNKRLRELQVYEREEEELLRQRMLKSPYEEEDNEDIIDIEVVEDDDEDE
jgi:hypothetical protein